MVKQNVIPELKLIVSSSDRQLLIINPTYIYQTFTNTSTISIPCFINWLQCSTIAFFSFNLNSPLIPNRFIFLYFHLNLFFHFHSFLLFPPPSFIFPKNANTQNKRYLNASYKHRGSTCEQISAIVF